jgi:hypothetical protein
LKTCQGAENMKTRRDALSTAEKRVRTRNTRKWDPRASVPSKTILEAQNVKTGLGALGTDENESGGAKHENGTRPLGTAENMFGSQKHGKGI